MAKVKTHLINESERYRIIGDFFNIVANLKSKKEVIDFFVGLLTPSESLMFARRIQIARMIIEDAGYEAIKKKLGVSYQTINKTEQWLHRSGNEYNEWITNCIKKGIGNGKKQKSSFNYGKLLNPYYQHKMFKNLFE